MFDFNQLDRIEAQNHRLIMGQRILLSRTATIIQKENQEMADLDTLITQSAQALVATRALADPLVAIKKALDDNTALIADLNAQIAANAGDPAKVAQLSQNMTDLLASIDTQAQAEAALANTPAAP